MEQSGTFIQYLVAKDGEVNRDFIEGDDIASLETQFTKRGKLRAKWRTTFPNGENYIVLVRQSSKWGPLDTYGYSSSWVLRATVNRVNRHEKYSEVVVIAYKDAKCTQPRSISIDDIMLKNLKKYYSKELAKWVERNQESELI